MSAEAPGASLGGAGARLGALAAWCVAGAMAVLVAGAVLIAETGRSRRTASTLPSPMTSRAPSAMPSTAQPPTGR
jgi:hypothetical protein